MTSSSRPGPASAATAPIVAWTLDELPLGDGDPLGGPEFAAGSAADHEAAEQAFHAALEDAYARGLADGAAAARAEARGELASAVAAVTQAVEAVNAGAQRWVENAEEHLCALAVGVARQIVEREIATDVGVVVDLVRHALAEFPIDQPVSVRVNPVDLALITGGAAEVAATVRRDATWVGDPRVMRGGCLVEGRDRIIDGRVDTALERLYRRLAGLGA